MSNKKRSIIILIFSVLNILLLSMAHAFNIKSIIFISLIYFLIIVLIASKSFFLPIMLFYLPWSPVLKFNQGDITFYTIGIGLFFIFFLITKELNEKKGIFNLENLFIVSTISIYTMIIKLFLGYYLSMSYFMFLLMLILIPTYLKAYYYKVSFEICIIFFSIGIITAGFASNILMKYPHMLNFIDISFFGNIGLTRLSGFYGDSNFYSAHIIVAICGLLIIILNKKTIEVIQGFILVIILIYLGFLSVSKMFLLILISILSIWVVFLLIWREKLMTKIIVFVCILIGTFIIFATDIFAEQINKYVLRFNMVSNVSTLTTGRSDIFSDYLNFFKNNSFDLILGQGFTDVYKGEISNAAHNTIIQIIYQFGISGSVLLIIWFINFIFIVGKFNNNIKWIKLNIPITIFAIACLGPWMALDILFADEFFFIMALLLVAINYVNSSNKRSSSRML